MSFTHLHIVHTSPYRSHVLPGLARSSRHLLEALQAELIWLTPSTLVTNPAKLARPREGMLKALHDIRQRRDQSYCCFRFRCMQAHHKPSHRLPEDNASTQGLKSTCLTVQGRALATLQRAYPLSTPHTPAVQPKTSFGGFQKVDSGPVPPITLNSPPASNAPSRRTTGPLGHQSSFASGSRRITGASSLAPAAPLSSLPSIAAERG